MQVFEGYLGTLFFFPPCVLFVVFVAFGDQQTTRRVVGPCLNGGAGDEKQYISWMCACLKEVHNMLTSLTQCRSYTQRSSTRNLVDFYLKLSKWWPHTLFLCHVVSERLMQMGQSGMLRRFAHCLRWFVFKVPHCLFQLFLVLLQVQVLSCLWKRCVRKEWSNFIYHNYWILLVSQRIELYRTLITEPILQREVQFEWHGYFFLCTETSSFPIFGNFEIGPLWEVFVP